MEFVVEQEDWLVVVLLEEVQRVLLLVMIGMEKELLVLMVQSIPIQKYKTDVASDVIGSSELTSFQFNIYADIGSAYSYKLIQLQHFTMLPS